MKLSVFCEILNMFIEDTLGVKVKKPLSYFNKKFLKCLVCGSLFFISDFKITRIYGFLQNVMPPKLLLICSSTTQKYSRIL